jgi:hypothetical protein
VLTVTYGRRVLRRRPSRRPDSGWLAGDVAAWLARECHALEARLAPYRHEMTWQVSGGQRPRCTGTCGRCAGSVAVTLTRPGRADIDYGYPIATKDALLSCAGGR